MKKFAVILIIAVLALGCVFAAKDDTGNSSTGVITPNSATSGDKVVVVTRVNPVFPVYEIVASDGAVSGATATSKDALNPSFIAAKSVDEDNVSIKIAVNHFGKKDNDMASDTKTDIRYKGNIKVSVTAGELKLVTDGKYNAAVISDTTDHILNSDAPTITGTPSFAGDVSNGDVIVFNCSNDSSTPTGDNKLVAIASYINGQKVLTGAKSVEIASCVFNWDISKLTAGDTYAADVVVTYTVE